MIITSKEGAVGEIRKFLDGVGIVEYAAFIGGSFFFASETDWGRFSNGKSDIDMIVVCKDIGLKSALLQLFPARMVEGFLNGEYSILNYAHRYGSGRNILHIKFMSRILFETIANLDPISFQSFRKESLAKKKSSASFASNSSDSAEFYYSEKAIEDGHILHYRFNPIQDDKFFLSDIHSMILFSICIHDAIGARPLRTTLLSKMRTQLRRSTSEKAVMQTFRYFSEKGLITEYWKNVLLGCFWLEEREPNSLYFQDSL